MESEKSSEVQPAPVEEGAEDFPAMEITSEKNSEDLPAPVSAVVASRRVRSTPIASRVPVNSLRRLVVAAALGALTVFLGVTRLGILPWFSGASLTILHVPALVGAILEGPLVGGAIGAIFGVFSLIQAYTAPAGPIDIAFQSPLVALPARVLFPIIAWLIYRGLSILFGKMHGKLILAAVPVSSLVGSLCHTGVVLFTLAIVVPAEDLLGGAASATVAGVLLATFVANGIPEAIAATVFVTVIVSIWTGVSSRSRSRVSEL